MSGAAQEMSSALLDLAATFGAAGAAGGSFWSVTVTVTVMAPVAV